jgi:hypothetical protein
MLRVVLVAILLAGCRVSLENDDSRVTGQLCKVVTTSASCVDAANQQPTLAWLEQNVFQSGCNFSGCHNGDNTRQGKVDLRPGKSFAHLVNFASALDPTRKLVVPNDVAASYLMLMLRDVPPDMASPPANPPPGNVGYMPQGSGTVLCCQKLDALERWIEAGAPSM